MFLVADMQLYKRLCPLVYRSGVIELESGKTSFLETICVLCVWDHGRRGALKLATSTKDFKTESESRPTYIQGEILKKIVIFLLFASLMNENLSF